jgi:hypothetical protein
MRATQYVRRGLIAFAAVASMSLGLVGVASAQSSGTAGFTADGDPVVLNPVPGYDYVLINTPGYGDTAVLGLGLYPGSQAVVVQFTGDVSGPTIIDPLNGNLAAYP